MTGKNTLTDSSCKTAFFNFRTSSFFSELVVCALVLFIFSCKAQNKQLPVYNFSFENTDRASLKPTGWFISDELQKGGYQVQVDSIIKKEGKYSLSINKTDELGEGAFGSFSFSIPFRPKGAKIKLTGYIKTENVTDGFAGLWLRVDGNSGMLSFDNMNSRGIKGTNDWKEYTIELPYNEQEAQKIVLGALLAGKGKVWADDFHLFVDGKPIEFLPAGMLNHEEQDTSFRNGSNIETIKLDPERIRILTNLGMVWGFLKYYHPAVAMGKYNWDAELFRILPAILAAAGKEEAYKKIEDWITALEKGTACDDCSTGQERKLKLKPDYGYLFDPGNLPSSLVKKLENIRDKYQQEPTHYYVSKENAGNAKFKNELSYTNISNPDAGIRLLALYRYWNIIQYYFPYRHLIGEDWNKVLPEFIPKFINAKGNGAYTLTCLEIIARIHDTHANLWSYNASLDSAKGMFMTPFKATFIENKLVVTDYYKDTLDIRNKLQVGDIIEKIDNVPVNDLVKKYLSLTPASNYETQLRDLPTSRGFLLRGNSREVTLLVKHGNEEKQIMVNRIPIRSINALLDYGIPSVEYGYKGLPGSIGYIYPAKLKAGDLSIIEKELGNTKGIIIDLRCYPSVFMPFEYGKWLKKSASPFVYFTAPDLARPGGFYYVNAVSNGAFSGKNYNGKIVILVNSQTQSQAEYTTMALSTAPGAVVLGSTTAGADGNVSSISLPGGISTMISGIGVYYPDSTETQRVGVKIDVIERPTINGIKQKRDELLEKAREIINKK